MDLRQLGSKTLSCESLTSGQSWMDRQRQPGHGPPPVEACIETIHFYPSQKKKIYIYIYIVILDSDMHIRFLRARLLAAKNKCV